MLYFWTPLSRKNHELVTLNRFYGRLMHRGLRVVGILAFPEDKTEAASIVAKNHITYDNVIADRKVLEDFGVGVLLPTIVELDEKLRVVSVGHANYNLDTIMAGVETRLRPPSKPVQPQVPGRRLWTYMGFAGGSLGLPEPGRLTYRVEALKFLYGVGAHDRFVPGIGVGGSIADIWTHGPTRTTSIGMISPEIRLLLPLTEPESVSPGFAPYSSSLSLAATGTLWEMKGGSRFAFYASYQFLALFGLELGYMSIRYPSSPSVGAVYFAGALMVGSFFTTTPAKKENYQAGTTTIAEPTYRTGLSGAYYNMASRDRNTWPAHPTMTRVDGGIDFEWRREAPAARMSKEWYMVRWTGEIRIPRTGMYTMKAVYDDGIRVWVGGKLVLENWVRWGEQRADCHLTEGWHSIKIDFWAGGVPNYVRLYWAKPGETDFELIPSAAFRTK